MSLTSTGERYDLESNLQERRDEILESLTGLLRERHLSTLTMEDIADRLGMTKGNLYNYFKNKQDLLYQCHIRAMESSFQMLEDAARVDGPPSARLRALVIRLAKRVIEDPYGAVLATEMQKLSPAQLRHFTSLRARFERKVRDMIDEGVRAGEFETSNVTFASFALFGAVQWIGHWYKSTGSHSPDDIAEFYADLVIRGLRATAPPPAYR
jgi:AcrR family transcriptional regulator